MPKQLSSAALDTYRRDGYYFPVPALTALEVAHYRGCLEKHEAETGAPLAANHRFMNFISSACDLLMRAPSVWSSLFVV